MNTGQVYYARHPVASARTPYAITAELRKCYTIHIDWILHIEMNFIDKTNLILNQLLDSINLELDDGPRPTNNNKKLPKPNAVKLLLGVCAPFFSSFLFGASPLYFL